MGIESEGYDDMDTRELCALAEELGCEVRYNEPLSQHCTFKVGGECEAFIELDSHSSVSRLIEAANEAGIRYVFIGNGSNVIFDDRGFRGVVFHLGHLMSGIELHEECNIMAYAGASLNRLCSFAYENSLTGLEFAYGIPGSVGGAVFMNAGAYGGEIKDVLNTAEVFDMQTGQGYILQKKHGDFEMGYRSSTFMDKGLVVLGGMFTLKKGDKAEIKARMDELMSRRREKQPLEYPSAGSTFKRPVGKFAGKLIQDSGLRGYTIGGAQVSEKHCGFVINRGGATSADILALIKYIQQTVKEKTGSELECEVKYIPCE